MFKISIIVPVYNVEKYLKRGLNSLVNQTFFEFLEIIIINDGSTDESLEICKRYEKKYENIKVYSQKNNGVSSARNLGLDHVSSKYVCFFDADDTAHYMLYEKLFNLIYKKSADIAMVDYNVVYENDNPRKKRKSIQLELNSKNMVNRFLQGGLIGNNIFDKIFALDSIKNINFYEGMSIGEDMYFIYEVLKAADTLVIDTSYAGYNYHKNENSTMNSNFSRKFFDTIYLSELIIKNYDVGTIEYEHAYAHLIHEKCKVVEYMLLNDTDKRFTKEKNDIKKDIYSYSVIQAKKNLCIKQFLGFLLLRISEKLYLFFYKLMKIN